MLAQDSVLFITLDSCRYDTFWRARLFGWIPVLSSVGPLHKAKAPSYFTYGSHAAFWMGFTPGVFRQQRAWLNPKAGKLFRMLNAGFHGNQNDGISLSGPNIIQGFNRKGYKTIGTGAVGWFDPATETGAVLGSDFHHFYYPGNTWSLRKQIDWIEEELAKVSSQTPVFVFLNIGETHVPYWHEGASWPREPSPCVPFGGELCSRRKSRTRQLRSLRWVDQNLNSLISRFLPHTILVCSDHGDCWGEDGLWEHGISHWATLTVPLLMRVNGIPVTK